LREGSHSLAEKARVEGDYAFVGGGAKNVGLVKSVEEVAGLEVTVPEKLQLIAAFGAALLAGECICRRVAGDHPLVSLTGGPKYSSEILRNLGFF
jgi:activator of 2-hydroxyglutaryl-CoA dehydratase